MAIYCDMRVESDDDVWQACLKEKKSSGCACCVERICM